MFQYLGGSNLWPRKKTYIHFLVSRYLPMFDIAFVIVFLMNLKHLTKKKKKKKARNVF